VAISALGLLALVFGYGDRKQAHKELAELAASMIAAIERVPAGQLDAQKVAGWQAEFLALCMKSPPPLKTLTLMCEREQSAADGHPEHVPQQPAFRRWTAHFM
jgi:hypothetical protein